MANRRIKKSVWLPAGLVIYLLSMDLIFGPELIHRGELTRLIVISAVELLVIILLIFFLRKREKF